MKKFLLGLLILIFVFLLNTTAYATSNQVLNEQMNLIQSDEIDAIANSIRNEGNTELNGFSFKDTITKIISGELDISPMALVKRIISTLLAEIYKNLSLLRNLIVITVICAVLKNLSSSFQGSSVSEVAFYVCYIILIVIVIDSFNSVFNLANGLIKTASTIMFALLPVMTTLLLATGNVTTASVYHPIVIFAIDVISVFIQVILLPIIYVCTVLMIINYFSEKKLLNRMSEMAESAIKWVLKIVAMAFMGILSFQAIGAPIVNKAVARSARAAVNVVPVVGEVLSGAVDTVLVWTNAIKNGAALAAILFLIISLSIPILKIFAIFIMYKFTAAVIEPISDSRIVDCLDGVGNFVLLILGACVTVAVMFIFSVVMVLAAVHL